MRIRRRAFVLSIAVFALAALSVGPMAVGGSVSGTFTGKLTATMGSVPMNILAPNNAINGAFGYTTTQMGAGVKQTTGAFAGAYEFNLSSLSANSGESLRFTVGVGSSWNDIYTSGAFTIYLASKGGGSQMTVTSATATGGVLTYTLTSATYATISVLPTLQSAVASFQGAGTVFYTTPDPWGTSMDGNPVMGTNFQGEGAVPEPSTMVLGVIASVTIGGSMMSRRRRRAA
jgi:hypothetical protein